MDVTVLYYSANVEDESFEQKIRDNILKQCGGLPIVSVTQKPVDFGKNICVGAHRACYFNESRQIQMGLREAKTEYVLVAEADCLYPPEYFQFEPKELGHCYRYDNVWVVYASKENRRRRFHFKGFSDSSQMVDGAIWRSLLDARLDSKQDWLEDGQDLPLFRVGRTNPVHTWTGVPVVTFKTGNNINAYTTTDRRRSPVRELPYWGTVSDLRKEMFGWES